MAYPFRLCRSSSSSSGSTSTGMIRSCIRGRIRTSFNRNQHRRHFSQQHHAQLRGIEIARFGLLCVFSLPFTIWISAFTYDYIYRVKICQDMLSRQDEDLLEENHDNLSGEFLGRDKELAEVMSLLDKEPSQLIVIAGGNESGKSRFVRELLKGTQQDRRGATLVQLAQLVDSVNSFTHVFVDAFDLRWLQLRNALVDVLPFAGSEILVMKERFSDRDLAQALLVVTEALKKNAKESSPDKPRPVIVIDGLGEGPRQWLDSKEGKQLAQRLLQWSIYIIKERRLAHIVLTGSEQLVMSLTDQTRVTRGHVRVVGLGDLGLEDAAKIVRSELPDATDDEIKEITNMFGGFVHDIKGASRDIQYRLARMGKKSSKAGGKKRKEVVKKVIKTRFQLQVERVVAAFADAREDTDSDDKDDNASSNDEDMDPYLDPLKSIYSEAKASSQAGGGDDDDYCKNWTQLQLWRTLQNIVDSPDMAVSFSELRDGVFHGDRRPILSLMGEDVLSFAVDRSSDGGWIWKVTPASPALGLAFAQLVKNGALKENFHQIEDAEKRNTERKNLEMEQARLQKERKNFDLRKKSLLQTIELGKEIGEKDVAKQRLTHAFKAIVREEEIHDMKDQQLRGRLALLTACNHDNDDGIANPPERSAAAQHMVHKEDDHLALQRLLKSAVLEILPTSEGSSDEPMPGLKNAFDAMDKNKAGKISAEELVAVVEASTGHDVSLTAAKELIKDWDSDDDKGLDYYEFLQMLLSNDKKRRKD